MGIDFKGQNDRLIHVIGCHETVRAVAVRYGELADRMAKALDAGPLAAETLSRASGAVLMMASLLKARQQVGLQINGSGPLHEVYAVSDASLNVRATVAGLHCDSTSFKEGMGIGCIQVIRKLDEDEPAYTGVIDLEQGEIASDLARYFLTSEQIPTAIALGEKLTPNGITSASGFLIQALPGASDQDLEAIVNRVEAFGNLSKHLDLTPNEILKQLLPDAHVLEEQVPHLYCPCSRETFARRLVALGEKDLQDLASEEKTEVLCHFCGTKYVFTSDEIRSLLVNAH